jgi:uncharacterized iron-regulated protein
MKISLLLLSLILSCSLFSQTKPAYKLFNSNGEEVSYASMIDDLSKGEVVLFGELHNNSIAHWLQYEVTKDLSNSRDLILGAEMIEADNQGELDDYLKGKIDQKAFDTLARLWSNHETDYAKLVDFAKENKLSFIATNIPRRYANMVFKKGFEALDELTKKDKAWIAPLPIPFDSELPRYKQILIDLGDHATPELVKAQAMKDATMAHFIVENRKKKELFIHYNGRYHSDYHEGIVWYLKQKNADGKYITITTVEQDDVETLLDENKGVADFVICVDSDMTTTY